MMMATKSILASAKKKGRVGGGKNSRDPKREEEFGNSWELRMRKEWASFVS